MALILCLRGGRTRAEALALPVRLAVATVKRLVK